MFKREILKYDKFTDHLKKLKLFAGIEEFIKNDDVTLNYTKDSIIISKSTEHSNVDLSVEHAHENKNKIKEDEYPEELIEEEHLCSDTYTDEEDTKRLEITYEQQDLIEIGPSEIKERKRYSYKSNTNESLTDSQLQWIKQQVKECEVLIEGKKKYKCSLCETILQIPGSLKKHLRDSHLLKSNYDKQLKESRDAFKEEIKRSKIVVTSKKGLVTAWKCERCPQDRLFRSEGGLKVHLRYSHIKGQFIDSEFIGKCKIVIQTETSTETGWQCPDCYKILKSRDTLRNHMKIEHADTVARIQSENSEKSFTQHAPRNSSSIQDLIEMKQKSSKSSSTSKSTLCEECGIKFVSGTTKKEKSFEIHQQLHIILKVVSKNYELPKCDCCRIMFSNNEVFYEHKKNHENKLYQSQGLTFLVGVKYAESLRTAEEHDESSWKCGHCGVCYQNEVECVAHQMILHSNQLICPVDYLEFTGKIINCSNDFIVLIFFFSFCSIRCSRVGFIL
jgi:hypothetical protein